MGRPIIWSGINAKLINSSVGDLIDVNNLSLTNGAKITITKNAHGWTSADVGRPLYHDGTTWQLAQADAFSKSVVAGFLYGVIDANTIRIILDGSVPSVGANFLEGGGSLTPGVTYYLSATTAGKVTATPPTGYTDIVRPTAVAVSLDQIVLIGASYGAGARSFEFPVEINVDSASPALSIRQIGSGNAFVVEDQISPDSTPFIINNNGAVLKGNTYLWPLPGPTSPEFQITGYNTDSSAVLIHNYDNPNSFSSLSFSSSSGFINGIITSGSTLGTIDAYGADGLGAVLASQIKFESDGTVGAGSMPARITFATTAASASTPTERMRISSSGNVGIGVTNPTSRLTIVDSTSQDAVRITQTGTGRALLVEDSANPDSTPFVIDTNGRVVVGHTAALTASSALIPIVSVVNGQYGSFRYLADAGGNLLDFCKSRNTTVGSHTIVSNNDELGVIAFSGSDGTAFDRAATISARVDGTPSATSMPGRLVFSTTPAGAVTPTEKMRIDSNGSVGIGSTTLAGRNLHLQKNLTGANFSKAIEIDCTISSDVTSEANGVISTLGTEAASFVVPNLIHFYANQGTIGAGSSVNNQYGFLARNTIRDATTNYGFFAGNTAAITTGKTSYGFYSDVNTATGGGTTWGFYAGGTAQNFFGGPLTISTSSTTDALRVTQTGTGNALVVEDSTNPDSTPFVIDTTGRVLQGDTIQRLNLSSTTIEMSNISNFVSGAPAVVLINYSTNGSFTSGFSAYRAGGGTVGSPTTVDNGWDLGAFNTFGHNGTSYIQATRILAEVDSALTANDMPGRLSFWTTPSGSTTPLERMRIDSVGNVAIGTGTAPFYRLDLRSPALGANANDEVIAANFTTPTSNNANLRIKSIRHTAGSAFDTSETRLEYNVDTSTDKKMWISFYNRNATTTNNTIRFGEGNNTEWMRMEDGALVVNHTAPIVTAVSTPFIQITGVGPSSSSSANNRFSNDTSPPYRVFTKSRSTNLGVAGAAVQFGDILGTILWEGDDGTTFTNQAAWLAAIVDGTPTTGSVPARLSFFTTTSGGTTPVERMRIDSNGNVGIGIASAARTTLRVGKDMTGDVITYGVSSQGTVLSDVTNTAYGFFSFLSTQASAFTLPVLCHYAAEQSTIGASSTVTSQIGYYTGVSLLGATNNYGFYAGNTAAVTAGKASYGFYSDVNTATGGGTTYGFYAAGTADNFFGGPTVISTSTTSAALRITQVGTGNALLVEDSANPDSTPFVVDASGRVIVNHTTALTASSSIVPNIAVVNQHYGSFRYLNNAGANLLEFCKSRSATVGTQQIVVNNDDLGTIVISGSNGTAFQRAVTITGAVDGVPSATSMPGRIVFSTTPAGTLTPTEKMRITEAGYVGINQTAPVSQLHLGQTAGNADSGTICIAEKDTTPANPANGTEAKIYMKADKFIIQYNDAGTVRYKYLDLTGTGVTWVHTTTAP